MAESMKGLKRSHRCAEVTKADIGSTVTLMGWVQKSRNKGGIVFVDLRDRSGIMQVIFENGEIDQEVFEKAGKLRSEFVIAVVGRVEARSGAVNPNLATGEIEVRARELRILSEAQTPPFPIEENSKTREEVRLKYRYLDLRRPDLQKNMILRSRVSTLVRQFWQRKGSWKSRLQLLSRVLLREQETIWCPAVYIREASMLFPSLPRSSSSCSCVPDMTGTSSWQDVTEMRT